MTTKSLTQGKPSRTRAELNAYTGKGGDDDHPLITCAPHVLGGHAHLKSSKTTVERVLLAELQRIEGPIKVSATGPVLTEEERRACLLYAVAIFENLSKLYAQLGQLQDIVKRQEKP